MSRLQLLIVLNPAAHGGRAQEILGPGLEALRAQGHRVEVQLTRKPGDVRRIVTTRARAADRVVVCGGDGTVSGAVSGLLDAGGTTPLVLVPAGTGNDLATALGLPHDPAEALALAGSGAAAPMDVGLVNGRPFVNALTGGAPAQLSQEVTPEAKRRFGRWAYVAKGLARFRSMRPFHARIRAGDAYYRGRVLFLSLANGRSVGGGTQVAPTALVDDGLLDLTVVPDLPAPEMLLVLAALRAGTTHPALLRMPVRELQLDADRTTAFSRDGEPLRARRLACRVLPGALRVVIHRGQLHSVASGAAP